jgi:hypothetical protein
MNALVLQFKKVTPQCLIVFARGCFALLSGAKAVEPGAPDIALANGNTADGSSALAGLTTGFYNSAFGFLSLLSNGSASFNTGVGAGALLLNTANENTATGAGALFSHSSGNGNTANGAFALFSDTGGQINTAIGDRALLSNTTGSFNAATGTSALLGNTTGGDNTADGAQALLSNTEGLDNTAVGLSALGSNSTGSNNVALGSFAGIQQTTGSSNVYIGAQMEGVAGESNACYIASIFGQTSVSGVPVLINSSNQLGTATSSKRFKDDIEPMGQASEALFSLEPVTFRYKKEIDPQAASQFGLVAEDVEKVNPDLIVRDKEGKPYTVRYDAVNAMLLNEFLKEHKKTEKLEATVASLIATVKEQAAQIQKVSAQLEASKPAPQVVNNP